MEESVFELPKLNEAEDEEIEEDVEANDSGMIKNKIDVW